MMNVKCVKAALFAACLMPVMASAAVNLAEEPIQPIPEASKEDATKVELGKALFHDTALSKDGKVSCARCHDLKKGGTDQAVVSTGVGGKKGPINSPTVYNSAHNMVQFWDGRAKDLQEQAAGPVENPKEMAEKWSKVEKKLAAKAEYKDAFAALYKGKVTKANVTDAIAAFERTLVTPDSRFDQYLKGDEAAITAEEKHGYELFKSTGCTSCHSGAYVGGDSYQQLNPQYFKDRGKITDADYGRFNVTKNEDDKHFFKVPMLRNVAVTAPYFHDGSQKTLEQAVKTMAKYQLGVESLPDADAKAIAAFLRSLTGKYNGVYLDKM
jgi:cytochrome c peroxidase